VFIKQLPEYIEKGDVFFSYIANKEWAQWLDSGHSGESGDPTRPW